MSDSNKHVKLFWVSSKKDMEEVNEFIGDRQAEIEVHQRGSELAIYVVRLV